jgi:hypothetical protein
MRRLKPFPFAFVAFLSHPLTHLLTRLLTYLLTHLRTHLTYLFTYLLSYLSDSAPISLARPFFLIFI